MTLEVIESYMSQMVDNEDGMYDDPFMWAGGNLGPEADGGRTYSDWLKHYGVEEDEEEEF